MYFKWFLLEYTSSSCILKQIKALLIISDKIPKSFILKRKTLVSGHCPWLKNPYIQCQIRLLINQRFYHQVYTETQTVRAS